MHVHRTVAFLARCLLDVVWPESCVACGDVDGLLGPGDRVPGLRPWDRPHCCRRCAEGMSAPGPVRGRLPDGTPLVAGAPTSGDLVRAVGDLKYRGVRGLAWPLAGLLTAGLSAEPELLEGDVLVPVPLHPSRASARGFNQAALLARLAGRSLGLSVQESAVRRRRHTAQQAMIAGRDRARLTNVTAAFEARPPQRRLGAVLVDDLVTSGATAVAVAEALRAAGWRVTGLACVGAAAARLDTVADAP